MGSGPKPVEGVKLREAVAGHEGAPGAHGTPTHSAAHAGGQAPVPRSMTRGAKAGPNHYDSPTSSLANPSGGRVPSANAAHEAAGGKRSASSSSAAAAPHDAVPSGHNQYTAAPTRGAHGEVAPRAEAASSSTSGQHQNGSPAGNTYQQVRQSELLPPSRQPSNNIEMRDLRSQATTAESNYGQTSFSNTASSNYNNNGLHTGANAAQAGYTAPPVGGVAAAPTGATHVQPTQVAGQVGAPGGVVAAPGGNPVYHAPPAVAAQQPVPTRFERFKAALKRNPKKSIGIPVVIVIASVVGGVLGGLRPWETPGVTGMGDEDNSMPPIPMANPGGQKLASGASLAGADLKSLVVPGSTESGFEIDAASFALYETAMSPEGKTTVETNDGTWTVSISGEPASAIGLLSFVPKATFAGGAADIYFSVKDKKGTESNRAKFTVQYGPKLHDGVLSEQDPKAKSVSFTVANWNEAAKTGVFEPHDMTADSALDPASIRFFDAATNSDKPSLDVAGAGSWSAMNGVIIFAPLAGSMAQMVYVTYSVKDKTGSVSNRATLTIAFKPEGIIVDPGNKDMTRKPVISSNIQIVVSGKPVTVPISSDINLKPDSLRIVSGTARVTSLPVSGNGTWTSAGNQLTFTPEPGYRGAPAPVSVTARSAFDVESDPFVLALMIFALPVVSDDFVSSTYPAVIKPLGNDKVGYTMENNALVPSSVEIFAVVSSTTGPVVAADRKSANVPMEGTWTVNADGSVTFQPVTGFAGGPKPISYTVADTKGSRSDPAVITLNRQVGDIATRFAAMMSMTQGVFFQNYVTALSDPAKKYSMFDLLDATNQLMLIFITEAQRVNQYSAVQAARLKPVAAGSSVTIIDAETDKAMMLWMAKNFTIQGLVDATDSIRDTLIGIPIGTAPIGVRALRLEVMADLIERYISTMMLVRAKSMT